MKHFESYISKKVSEGMNDLADAINNSVKHIVDNYIKKFNYTEHVTGLILGHVQSGKTSHMLGVISAAADEGFNIFILLTTDNIYLYNQTLKRAENDLATFNVCDEDDEIKFVSNLLKRPSLIILKKNNKVLKKWRGNLSSSGYCIGNPIFIVDDEGDAASLNTMVNSKKVSTINNHLRGIKKLSSCSIYLEVTATPQALILQTKMSGWKPEFMYYFPPGKNYIGGDYFFSDEGLSPSIVLIEDKEIDDLLYDDEFASNGLIKALLSFLVASAHIFLTHTDDVCNFLVHPSYKINDHERIAEKIGDYLNTLLVDINELQLEDQIKEAYNDLQSTKPDIVPFNEVVNFIQDVLSNNQIKIIVMNSISIISDYSKGINIIVGGNSLGRGITFPRLQTTYYCRRAKIPQADTVWQHSRMFGYDRDRQLLREYISPTLYKVFSNINNTNNSIIAQIEKNEVDDIKLYYQTGIRPTRPQVIDKLNTGIIAGGVNYFPYYPINNSIETLDTLLSMYGEDNYYTINLKLMMKYLELIDSEVPQEWPRKVFISCIQSYIADKPGDHGILIIRRDRDISKSTGTLLSPNDRALGKSFNDKIVLTLYKVVGAKGWEGRELWIPNIKFPENVNFYSVNEEG